MIKNILHHITLTFILLAFLSVLSCNKKGNDTKVLGSVINGITQGNVPGASLVIVEWQARADPKSTFKEIKFFESDINGRFEIEIDTKRNQKYSYMVGLQLDNQMYADNSYFSPYGGEKILKNEDNHIDLYLFPGGIINVNFSPPPPYNAGDFIYGTITHANTRKEIEVSSSEGNFSTGIIYMGNYIVEIIKKKSGVTDTLKEVIWLDWNEEKNYIVYY